MHLREQGAHCPPPGSPFLEEAQISGLVTVLPDPLSHSGPRGLCPDHQPTLPIPRSLLAGGPLPGRGSLQIPTLGIHIWGCRCLAWGESRVRAQTVPPVELR